MFLGNDNNVFPNFENEINGGYFYSYNFNLYFVEYY